MRRSVHHAHVCIGACRIITLFFFTALTTSAWASSLPDTGCTRFTAGTSVINPPELRSEHGLLELTLYFRGEAAGGATVPLRYCYVTDSGLVSPTLRLNAGDQLIIHFRNQVNVGNSQNFREKTDCSGVTMNATDTNLHFHGLNLPPLCHQDDVLHTTIQPGQSFDYRVVIPKDEPPGLYWYHPHMHGFTEPQVQGGASGAIIIDNPSARRARKFPERLLVLRDQPLSDVTASNLPMPAWDISVNHVPVLYKQYLPAQIEVTPNRTELWRVLNSGAGTIFDLQLIFNGKPQILRLVALDGVAIDPKSAQSSVRSILLPPASRAEFLVTTPPAGTAAQLITREWDTGPVGDADPGRPIANLVMKNAERVAGGTRAKTDRGLAPIPINDLRSFHPTATRKLFFSELADDPNDPDSLTYFFLTVAGQRPAMFDMHAPPNLVVHQGAVEDWLVENRAQEDHVFHTHQLHFQVLELNGKPVKDREIRDTVNIEHWQGSGPYPSVRVRMDFRPSYLAGGVFPFHCHILRHEDMGMMGSIKVLPSSR